MLIRDAHTGEFPEIGDVRIGAYRADGFLSPDSSYAPPFVGSRQGGR